MTNKGKQTEKLTILAIMIALDVVLSPIFRVEGMAPMSSVINVIGATMLGPVYVTIMATLCGIIRMLIMGIPPLALTGAIFGAVLAGIFYKITGKVWAACLGEIIGTGIIGSLLSYPVMVLFTGSTNNLYWFVYTPRFIGAAIIGSIVASIVLLKLIKVKQFQKIQQLFFK
ncbi:energy coupling factor transporter S component ThiW [Lactobacillus sp. ESL0731]|uniref:energy coupling factor transporter S component ThiW n=1 Tax=unclassified Lactobacillus TaxID=2620435 RepID=UPI0023F93109|nr:MULTISPECIES: energy coupling factor transporter S component ThiW [unclassified Lactobacillus]WEV51285.1 energy coupling factor transporter S component ThiW [Lactobacillus sp. ESL0700]WEV62415.1 energy coupling factor transporter S component ThiW [Lactobacillus sp. ESL0731]